MFINKKFILASSSKSRYKILKQNNLNFLKKDTVLREELLKLNAKKFVFTNGSHDHVKNVTKHIGIDDLFGKIGFVTIGIAVVTLLISPIIKKLMHEVH